MSDVDLRRGVLNLLAVMMSQAGAQDLENAIGFTVCTYDPETDHRMYHGFWENPFEAMVWAVAHQEDVNKGALEGEKPFEVTVEFIARVQ